MDSERSIPNPTINKMDFLGRVIGVIKSKEVATKDPFADDTYAKISKSKIGKNRYHPFQKEAVALREDKKRLLEQVEDLKADLEQVQSVCDVLAAEQSDWKREQMQVAAISRKLASYGYRIPIKIFGRLHIDVETALSEVEEEEVTLCYLRNPAFYPFRITVDPQTPNAKPVMVVNENDEALQKLRLCYPAYIVNDILKATLELVTWNGSSRIPVSIPWNYDVKPERQMTVSEICQCLFNIIINNETSLH